MSAEPHIDICRSRREWRLFERIPEILHGDDPAFVPPFPGQVMKLRDPAHPFRRDGSMTAYVARRGGRPVGRVASIVNRTHNAFHGDRTGFFGFFDFTDADVARALLARVCADMRAAGLAPVRGPFGPTQNDECGVQVEGFGGPPYFLMPFNPRFYAGVYEQLGLVGVRDLLAYRLEPHSAEAFIARTASVVERIRTRFRITSRTVDRARVEEECELVARLFNASLAHEWNFMPLSAETALSFVRELIDWLEPDAMTIAEAGGRPIGLSIGLPDVNEFLADAGRLPRWLRWPRIGWLLQTRRPKHLRWAVFGMLPEYHRQGATVLLLYDAVTRFRERYPDYGEMSWTQDVNRPINSLVEQFGLAPYRRYRIYEAPCR